MERSIVHLNVADFAVAVERVIDCSLRQRPVIIAPPELARGLVYDMSEEAYQAGVRKGMILARAKQYCRDAVVVQPRPERYEQAMKSCLQRARSFSPLVERAPGDGHVYLDLTGTSRLFGPPVDVAWKLRKVLRADLALDPIWALGSSKLVAKVASRLVKPQGEYIVDAGGEGDFLAPLPVHLLPGIGREEVHRLAEFNLYRNRDIAALSLLHLAVILPRHRALFLHEAVRGIDSEPVLPASRPPSQVVFHHSFPDSNDWQDITAVVFRLTEQCGYVLRQRQLVCRRVGLSLIYSDGRQAVRQATARNGATTDQEIFVLAKLALQRSWNRRVRLRFLQLTCDRLARPAVQRSLFAILEQQRSRQHSLAAAVDQIRASFGESLLQRPQIINSLHPS